MTFDMDLDYLPVSLLAAEEPCEFSFYFAFWKMYGLDLPDEVLKKIYYKNALRLIPGIDASLFPK